MMHLIIDIEKAKLKSINNKYKKNFKLTDQYRFFKSLLYYSIKKPLKDLKPPYKVHIYKKSYLDIDNTVKAILDVMEGAILTNDNNVLELSIFKLKRKRGHDSALRVYVDELSDQEIKEKFSKINFADQ
jgi:Holliday junction resolvase RusA-like endonuclease